jgi:predicted kinase
MKIIVVVGNIGSGKSTYIRKLHTAFKNDTPPYIVIARDTIRYMMGGGNYVFNPTLEEVVWQSEMYMIRRFLQKGCNIIVDEVGISRDMRKKYIQLAKEFNYDIEAHVFPRLTMQESVDRRMNNPHECPDRELWEGVWKKFDNRYQEPTVEEGFAFIRYMTREEIGV